MPRGIKKTEEINLQIVELLNTHSLRKISKDLNVPYSTVQYIAAKYKANHTIKDERENNVGDILHKTEGRKKKCSHRDQKIIRFITKNAHNRRLTAQEIKNQLKLPISCSTIRHILNKNGYQCRKPVKKPKLLPRHIQSRLNFCNKYKD